MRACATRFVRLGTICLLASLLFSPIGRVAAQDESTPAVDGNTYTSPTFGFTLSWDDTLWGVTDEHTADGNDSLTLESDSSILYAESLYLYEGNPAECVAG